MADGLNLQCGVCGWVWLAERPAPDTCVYTIECPRCRDHQTKMYQNKRGVHPLAKDPPPWISDAQPQLWVRISDAARYVFHKSPRWIATEMKSGSWGLKGYYDGYTWWVRLEQLPSGMRNEA